MTFMKSVTYGREGAIQRLRQYGISPTHQRIQIAAVLFEKPQHLSADQILERVNAQHAEVSKATVYNTLKLFCESGMLREVIVDPKRVFYDPTMTPHHHIYNVDTGDITDVPTDGIAVSGLPALPAGTVSAGVDIVVRVRAATPALG